MLQIVAQIVLSLLTQGTDAAEGFPVVLKMCKFVNFFITVAIHRRLFVSVRSSPFLFAAFFVPDLKITDNISNLQS